MSRYRSSLSVDERNLLNEMEGFASWLRNNKRDQRILLRPRQFVMFKRICGRLKEHAIADSYVENVDKENRKYAGFTVACVNTKEANRIEASL